MQHLSAYLLEVPDIADTDGRKLYDRIVVEVDDWLTKKGIVDLTAGVTTFVSKTGGKEGTVWQSFFSNEQGDLREIILEEPTTDDHVFRTALRVVRTSLRVVVYLTLAARNVHSIIRPGFVVPRCPQIIHTIRGLRNDWHLGDTKLGPAGVVTLSEEADGIALASQIRSSRRTMPIVAVSVFDGEEPWEGLSRKLARDLSALATVVTLTADVSWGLTDEVGKRMSCYGGAVRLYWPPLRGGNDSNVPGRVWTPERLDAMDWDGEGQERLRTQLRYTVMSAAALGVEPPFEIREIRTYGARMRLRKLEAQGQSAKDTLELVREFDKENDALREENKALQQVIAQMKGGYQAPQDAREDAGDDEGDVEEAGGADTRPEAGEIRFYKKRYSKHGYDVLVRRGDCGHEKWEAAFAADKAKKGLKRLEGRDDWQMLNHCASCTGGGVWRVRW